MSRWNPFDEGMSVSVQAGPETALGVVREILPDRMKVEVREAGPAILAAQTVRIAAIGTAGRLQADVRVVGREDGPPLRLVVSCHPPEAEQREYVRVDDVLPIQVERVPPGQEESVSSRFVTPPPGVLQEHPGGEEVGRDEMEDLSPALIRHIKTIEDKLDMILTHLKLKDEGLTSFPSRPVNLSGAGVKFFSEERFEVGEAVVVKLVLPLGTPVGIETPGRVAWVCEHPDRSQAPFETAIRFEGITEDVRDAVIHYTFQRQREVLRSRWEG